MYLLLIIIFITNNLTSSSHESEDPTIPWRAIAAHRVYHVTPYRFSESELQKQHNRLGQQIQEHIQKLIKELIFR